MADPEANVIYGIVTNESLRNAVRVTVIATGFEADTRNGNGAAAEAKARAAQAKGKGTNGNGNPEAAARGGFMRRLWGGKRAKE